MYTASTAWLEALNDAGVSYIFANLGSDHPGLMETMAEAMANGRKMPKLITCPNEMVALSLAQGYAQVTGKAQMVLIHVECGTQALAGAVHNVAKCRTPVLIFAGASPFTQEGELLGSRNEFIHWIQDVFDQRGIVRGYMKYENEIRTGRNLKQMIHRALQFAHSEPPGPTYLMATREVLEEEVPRVEVNPANWPAVEMGGMTAAAVASVANVLAGAKRPLVVTSYLGRNPQAVIELQKLAERLAIGVLDSASSYTNFPAQHPMYQGYQGNEPVQNPVLADADVILVADCDVPWIPLVNHPNPNAKIFHIDMDPLKEQMPMWYIATEGSYQANAATALAQLNDHLDSVHIDQAAAEERCAHYTKLHNDRAERLRQREQKPDNNAISSEYLTACVREAATRDAIFLNEGITNYKVINEHIGAAAPRMMYTSGGSSLGWNGGAALGAKLADPDRLVVSLTGDGSFMFTVPSSVHWISGRYKIPFLQVIYNNGGWNAPRFSAVGVHKSGLASKGADLGISLEPPADYSGIAAAAGGAHARIVKHADELPGALAEAIRIVQEGRSAVLDVWLRR